MTSAHGVDIDADRNEEEVTVTTEFLTRIRFVPTEKSSEEPTQSLPTFFVTKPIQKEKEKIDHERSNSL